MKNFKRLIAAALVLIMVLSFAGCHKKNEIAVTIGDVEFTSAYYMCALINADLEAKNLVNETLTEEEKKEEIDYYSKKVEDTDYVEWVENKAIETLKEVAAYKILCKENKLELKDEDVSMSQTYANYYWSSYGYAAYFEPNGVALSTYTDYMTDSYYAEYYFEHLYAAEGEKAIAAADVEKKLYDNFIIADVIEASITSDMKDADKTALKTKLEGYVTALKDGKKTFEQVYNEYNEIKETDKKEEADKESDEPTPKDKYATVLGAKDTGYDHDQYDTIKAMATGEVKLITLEEDAGYVLAVKQDIKADPYYLETLDMTIRHLIADKDFEKLIADYAKELKPEINKYAVGQFKVKKIVEPTYG